MVEGAVDLGAAGASVVALGQAGVSSAFALSQAGDSSVGTERSLLLSLWVPFAPAETARPRVLRPPRSVALPRPRPPSRPPSRPPREGLL